mgnify:CR=1 FL=1
MNRFLSAVVVFSMVGCGSGTEAPTDTGSGTLETQDTVVGSGATAVSGDTLTVHYIGSFLDGRVFESSYTAGRPYTFRLGAGQVIPGWDQGIEGMKVGGRRRLTIPPHLGYGDRGAGAAIRPGETLIFVVDLMDVR